MAIEKQQEHILQDDREDKLRRRDSSVLSLEEKKHLFEQKIKLQTESIQHPGKYKSTRNNSGHFDSRLQRTKIDADKQEFEAASSTETTYATADCKLENHISETSQTPSISSRHIQRHINYLTYDGKQSESSGLVILEYKKHPNTYNECKDEEHADTSEGYENEEHAKASEDYEDEENAKASDVYADPPDTIQQPPFRQKPLINHQTSSRIFKESFETDDSDKGSPDSSVCEENPYASDYDSSISSTEALWSYEYPYERAESEAGSEYSGNATESLNEDHLQNENENINCKQDSSENSMDDKRKLFENEIQNQQQISSTTPTYRPSPTSHLGPLERVSSYRVPHPRPGIFYSYDISKNSKDMQSKAERKRNISLEIKINESNSALTDIDEQKCVYETPVSKPAPIVKSFISKDCEQNSDSNENTYAVNRSKIENLLSKRAIQFKSRPSKSLSIDPYPTPPALHHSIVPSQQRHNIGLLSENICSDKSDSHEDLPENLQQKQVRHSSLTFQQATKEMSKDVLVIKDNDEAGEHFYDTIPEFVETHKKKKLPDLKGFMKKNRRKIGTLFKRKNLPNGKEPNVYGEDLDLTPYLPQAKGFIPEFDEHAIPLYEKSIILKELDAEFFKRYLEEELTAMTSDTNFTIEQNDKENGICVTLRGLTDMVEDVGCRLDAIHKKEINISQVTTSEKNLVMRTLDEHCGQEYCRFFEKSNKCIVSVEKIGTNSYSNSVSNEDINLYMREYSLMFGNTDVKLKLGALANHKAGCLVNIIGPKMTLHEGVLSKAILEVSGPKLEQLFKKKIRKHRNATVVSTSGTGRLKCEQVLHVILEKKPNDFKQVIHKTVGGAIKHVSSKLETIAFPPLGVGRMYDYPPTQVAEAMLEALVEFLPSTKLKKVEFVIYKNDYGTFDAFKTVFESWSSKQAEEKNGTLAMTITSETEVMCVEAMNKFVNSIRSTFLYEDKLITKYQIDDIVCNIAKVNLVMVKKVEDGYELKGFKDNVQSVLKEATGVITQRYTKNTEPLASKEYKHSLARCTKELVDYMTKEDVSVPWHWSSFKPGHSLKDIVGEKISCKLVVLEKSCLEYSHITDMVDSLWTKERFKVGLGRDANGLGALNFSNLRIVKVERIENVDLYREYAMARQRQFAWLKKKELTHFCPVKFTSLSPLKVLTFMSESGKLLHKNNDINEEVNEVYLYHGTNNANVKVICDNGLDSRLAVDKGMFGQGVYASESPVKADQYADSAGDRTAGLREDKRMFLIRMTLGKPYICTDENPPKYKRPPCTKCFKPVCRDHSEFFDSVVGDNESKLFREFIVYEKSLCYPEYLITYNRV